MSVLLVSQKYSADVDLLAEWNESASVRLLIIGSDNGLGEAKTS